MRKFLGAAVGLVALAAAAPAQAQLSCTIRLQSDLLTLFSDNAPTASITPGNVRDIICSSVLPFGSAQQGQVPPSGGGTVNFLRADGTWAPVSAGITQLTGDVTAGPGTGSQAATIAANAVTNAKAAQMGAHTYKGNNTGSTANAADVTSTQLTADLNLFSSTLQGLVPSSGGGTTNFLRADGSFTVPPGTGVTTSSPLTGTTALACATCVTSAASLTNNALMLGAAGQASQTDGSITASAGALSVGSSGVAGSVVLGGATSGTITVKPAATAGSNTVTLPAGTTDFSATGGASQVVKQTSSGGAFTVATENFTDLAGSIAAGQVPANLITNAMSAQGGANTMKGNWTGSTANEADNAMPSCSDVTGNHLNYVSGTGITCGTSVTTANKFVLAVTLMAGFGGL